MNKFKGISIAILITILLLICVLPLNSQPVEAQLSLLPHGIIYPPEADTDFEKLVAVYSLVEQMRLEHNRQGAIALSDWERYKDKWYTYAVRPAKQGGNIYTKEVLPLLQEQNRLRDKIKATYFTRKKWESLTREQQNTYFELIFGNKILLKRLPTKATSPRVDSLKSIVLDNLTPASIPDPVEDFTTYTETDPNNDFTVTATKVDVDTMSDNIVAYVNKDMTADHFGDFEHLITAYFGSVSADDALGGIWHISDGYHNEVQMNTNNNGISVRYYAQPGGTTIRMYLTDWTNDNSDFYSFSRAAVTQYLTNERNDTTFTVKVYSDAARTVLVDTITVTCGVTTYRYIYTVSAYGGNLGGPTITYYVENLDLQEGGISLPTVTSQAATNVEDTTATGNGNITNTGGENCTIRGIVWDLATHADPGNVAPGASGYANDIHTHGSFGTGAFTESLTGLPTGDTIYYRAYAYNSAGYDYSNTEQSFLTKPAAPTNVAATDGSDETKVVITWTKSTGATDYHVWRGVVDLGAAGDVATFDDNGATAGTITSAGNVTASDGTSTAHVTLSLAGEATGVTIHSYTVVASNASGNSDASAADNGNRTVGAITYQWQENDAGWANIVGATTDPYNDTTAGAPTVTAGNATASDGTSAAHVTLSIAGDTGNNGANREYQCIVSATNASNSPQTSDSNIGYRGTTALTYDWQRSAADADAAYASIAGEGGTTDPYNDTNGVVDPDGRWYYAEVSMTDASNNPQDTTHDRGYKVAALPQAPTDFVATYVSETQVTLTWVTGVDATDTYIRGKQGSYPVDRTDGYLVYDGALETEDDTTMNFDILGENVYYRGWGYTGAIYSVDYAEDNVGGKTVLFLSMLLGGVLLAYFSWKGKNILITLGASIMWLFILVYTRENPLEGATTGSTADTFLLFICVVMAIGVLLQYYVARGRTESVTRVGVGDNEIIAQTTKSEGVTGKNLMNQSVDEYRASVRKSLRRRRR